MKGGKRPRGGYTIAEVLVVLAISGVMFLLATQFINGRNEKATFTAGVNEMASRLQDTIEQVSDGQYSDIPVNCAFNGTTTSFPSGTNNQGTNAQCVFLGKILHFAQGGSWAGSQNGSHYEVFSIAGGRLSAGIPVVSPIAANAKSIPGLTKQQTTAQSLNIQKVTVNGTTQSFGIGFFQGQGSLDANNNLQNGTSPVKMYYINNLTANMDNSQAANQIDATVNLTPAQSVDICLTDGSQEAHLKLGLNGSQLAVDVKRNGFVASPC